MRKILCVILIISLSFCICSCDEHSENAVTFYYVRKDLAFSIDEPMIVEVAHHPANSPNYESIINQYFSGPYSNDLASPFPEGLLLQAFVLTDSHLSVTLSNHMDNLTASRQTIAFACITKTLIGLTGVDTVEIIVDNSTSGGQRILSFSVNSFAHLDTIGYEDIQAQ